MFLFVCYPLVYASAVKLALSRFDIFPIIYATLHACRLLDMAKLVPAIQRYCQAGTLRTARWGPVALWGLLGRSDGSASDVLERMASEAMSRLRPSAVAEAGTPAALQTICSIGRVAPRVFAGMRGVLGQVKFGRYKQTIVLWVLEGEAFRACKFIGLAGACVLKGGGVIRKLFSVWELRPGGLNRLFLSFETCPDLSLFPPQDTPTP